jgi:hypothetical protein
MCYALFVGVRGHPGDPAAVFIARGYTVEVSGNPTCAQLEIPEVLAVSDGHCACWLYIPTQRYVGEDTQLMRSRYRRKGWPDGKVERAVKARCVADEKRAARRADRNQFLSMIEELIKAGAEVSLLAHFFDGSFDEPFPVHTQRRLLLVEFLSNGGTFQEDELTVIGG